MALYKYPGLETGQEWTSKGLERPLYGLIRLFNTLKNLFVSFAEPKGNKTEKTVEGAIRPPPWLVWVSPLWL